MSDCNCKTRTEDTTSLVSENKTQPKDSFIRYFIKSIGFIFSLLLLPIINIMIIKLLFQTIVNSNRVELKKIIEYYFKNKKLDEIDDDDDYLELTENDVEMLNVEEIK